jgi:hypothetical protein
MATTSQSIASKLASCDARLIKAAYNPTKLFAGGLSRKTTSKSLRDHFSRYGRILDCVAMTKKDDGSARSFGFVTLDSVVAAEAALMDQHMLDGHLLDVKPTQGKTILRGGDRRPKPSEQAAPAAVQFRPPPGLAGPPPGLSLPQSLLPPPGFAALVPEMPKQSKEEVEDDSSSTAPPSSASTREESDEETTQESQEGEQVSPPVFLSLGSMMHAAGTCKPCNFFAKGKCESGSDCTFCHLTHEKRRPTRQEKRDRKSTWLQKQVDIAAVKPKEEQEEEENCATVAHEGSDFGESSCRWSRAEMLEVYAAMQRKPSPSDCQ